MRNPDPVARWTDGQEHWTGRAGGIELFMWRKPSAISGTAKGVILFVHGSSMASQPTFDLAVPGGEKASIMDWFSARGFDTWCFDSEGYGRSSKHRDINCDIANGVEDLTAVSGYVMAQAGGKPLLLYGVSSGALKAAVFAQKLPQRVARLALDAFVWTGEGSPTLIERRKRIEEWRASNRRPLTREFLRSIFLRDGFDGHDSSTIEAFADAVLALDDTVPNGTYVDMCENLPMVDPGLLNLPTLILRGEFDGVAALQDLVDFFARLRHQDRQFSVLSGCAHGSLHGPRKLAAYHVLHSFFTQP